MNFKKLIFKIWNNNLKLDDHIDDYILFLKVMKTFAFLVEEKLMSDNEITSDQLML